MLSFYKEIESIAYLFTSKANLILLQNVKKKMKSLMCVFLLLFMFSLEVMYCEGCWKQEREALVALTFSLENDMTAIPTDCCEWEGVECNTTTGRVTKIKLQYAHTTGSLNYSDFAIFKDLKTLDLSFSTIPNCTGTHQGYFSYKVKINRF